MFVIIELCYAIHDLKCVNQQKSRKGKAWFYLCKWCDRSSTGFFSLETSV